MQGGVYQGKQGKPRNFFPGDGQFSFLQGAESQHQQPRREKADPREQNFTSQIRRIDLQFPIPQLNKGIGQ